MQFSTWRGLSVLADGDLFDQLKFRPGAGVVSVERTRAFVFACCQLDIEVTKVFMSDRIIGIVADREFQFISSIFVQALRSKVPQDCCAARANRIVLGQRCSIWIASALWFAQ